MLKVELKSAKAAREEETGKLEKAEAEREEAKKDIDQLNQKLQEFVSVSVAAWLESRKESQDV